MAGPTVTDPVARRADPVRGGRAGVAAALLVLGLLLPWNLYVGLGIPGTPIWAFAVVAAATVVSLAGLAVGRRSGPERLQLLLGVPYFVVVVGFLVFTTIQAVRYGGTASVPPGVGPGAWLGTAGALLAAGPGIGTGRRAERTVSIIAIVSLVLGLAAAVFNLHWRTRFVLPAIGEPDVGTAHLATALAALLYAVVAVIPLVIGYRWLWSTRLAARVATLLLAVSALVAGMIVWVLPVGREVDAFHGIAQNTGISGVGYEGYLSWVAVAAIVAVPTVSALRDDRAVWRRAVRRCLLLIGAWCAGTAVLRLADVALSAALDLPAPPYNGTALMAFDLLAAVLAWWLFLNAGRFAPGRMLTTLFAVLFAAVVSRVIVGIALVPRSEPLDPATINAVFGNTLVQQITSTFDVTLVVLALALSVIAIMTARPARPTASKPAGPAGPAGPAERRAAAPRKSASAKPTIVIPTRSGPARIVRPGHDDD